MTRILCGCDAYETKPTDVGQLVEKVRSLIGCAASS